MAFIGVPIAICAIGGCSKTVEGSPEPVSSPAASRPTPSDESTEVDVEVSPARTVAASCSGNGTPVVIYLHGLIQPTDSAKWAHEYGLRSRLDRKTRYCEYERTNVGNSSDAKGPVPLTESVADLHAVVDEVGLGRPVVLLGGSFGGMIAYTYAGTHPDSTAGVVLLDPTLPDEPALERAYLPKGDWLQEDAWQESREKIDTYHAYGISQKALANISAIPGTIFVTEELWAPEGNSAELFRKAVRAQQKELIDHFTPAKTITVDVPHAMAAEIPDEIAAAVLDIVAQAR